jgi:hypothetical protein
MKYANKPFYYFPPWHISFRQHRTTWMEDDLWRRTWAVMQRASQKPNSFSPVQDRKSELFWRSALPFTGAHWRSGKVSGEVDYGGGTSRQRQNLDQFQDVCDGSRARVYIGTTEENPSNVGSPMSHARFGYSSPRYGSDPNWLAVTGLSKTRSNLVILCNKKISSARGSIPQKPRRPCIVSKRARRARRRSARVALLFLLAYQVV